MLDELQYVVDNSNYVKLHKDKINDFAETLEESQYVHWSKELDFNLTEKEWILLATIVESMNFCFWKKPRWNIDYKGERIKGSMGMYYSVFKQVENNKNFLNIDYLVNLTRDEFDKIFEGQEICPHLDKRYENFKQVVTYIKNNNYYDELFAIKKDTDLIKYIVTTFKCFDDKSEYKGKMIHIYKRATLLANDLYRLSETIRKNINNVDNLTGCADYVLPQMFRDLGILEYNEELANMVDNEIEIPQNSEMEVELRAHTLYVIELLRKVLNSKGIKVNSVELDNIIWKKRKTLEKKTGYHHTVTIFY